jgi:hypothetical protein
MGYRLPDPDRTAEARAEEARERAADEEVIAAMRRGPPLSRIRWARVSGAFLVASAVSLPLLYGLAILVAPPVSGGHPVMPIGQAGFALVFAPVLGIVAGWLVARPRR